MSIRDLMQSISSGWEAYRAGEKTNAKNPTHQLVSKEYPAELARLAEGQTHLKFSGSGGQGIVSAAPWVATFDTRITKSAQDGFYPVYLFSADLERVYLSFGMGLTQFDRMYGENKRSLQKLQESVGRFRNLLRPLGIPEGLSEKGIDLFSAKVDRRYRGYEVGTIFAYPAYQVQSLPEEDRLQEDYQAILDFYRRVVEDPTIPTVDEFVEATAEATTDLSDLELVDFESRPPKKGRRGAERGSAGNRRNRDSIKVGNAGEMAVLRAEEAKLKTAGRDDLVEKIDYLASRSETPGWDISSFEIDGTPIYIEVKASRGKLVTSIELTRNEWLSAQRPSIREGYRIYIVTEALSPRPKIEVLKNPSKYIEEGRLSLSPSVYELSLRQEVEGLAGP